MPTLRVIPKPIAILSAVLALLVVLAPVLTPTDARAQQTETGAKAEAGAGAEGEAIELLPKEELEQLVAPIALHPDALVSQILMASTYPLEVVEAQRWVKANPGVEGDALETAMQKEPWDPSVKSLTAFPEVLDMMSDEISWTQQLGDAFLAQQEDVLAAIQTLRAQADAAGNLKTTKEQKVEKQAVTTDAGQKETVYVIEPSNPEVIYVPSYDPTVVYGTWAYPNYPPYYWYPPGYVAGRVFWFAAGVAVGSALWGRCDWRRGNVNININRYNSFNRTNITNNRWTHNSIHRKGVPYRGRNVSNRYGKGRNDARAKARDQFRGRADTGRKNLGNVRPGDIKRPNVGGKKPNLGGKRPAGPGKMPNVSGKRPNLSAKKPGANRPAVKKPASRPKVAARPAAKRPKQASRPAKKPAAFKGVGNSKKVKKHSSRGKASRSASRARKGGGGRRGGGRRR